MGIQQAFAPNTPVLLMNLNTLRSRRLYNATSSRQVCLVPASQPAQQSSGGGAAATTADAALTEADLLGYIAVKKALAAYWTDPAHAALRTTASATGHSRTVQFGSQRFQFGVYDYPSLVPQDTALATLFAANHFTPEQFEPTQTAAWQAVGMALVEMGAKATNTPLPAMSAVLAQNVALVEAHRTELTAVGIDEGLIH